MTDLPLMTYVATMSVTPGPNNLMLAASGVNFGLRRTVPHMLGVNIGHGIQVGIVASLLSWVMAWLDDLRLELVLAGCAYLLWLAWRQANAGRPGGGKNTQPFGFIGAALFQWVNPKAWMMALNAAILFLPHGGGLPEALSLTAIYTVVNFPCIAVWAVIGDRLRHRLSDPRMLRIFNWVMAMLLAATAIWILIDEAHLAGI